MCMHFVWFHVFNLVCMNLCVSGLCMCMCVSCVHTFLHLGAYMYVGFCMCGLGLRMCRLAYVSLDVILNRSRQHTFMQNCYNTQFFKQEWYPTWHLMLKTWHKQNKRRSTRQNLHAACSSSMIAMQRFSERLMKPASEACSCIIRMVIVLLLWIYALPELGIWCSWVCRQASYKIGICRTVFTHFFFTSSGSRAIHIVASKDSYNTFMTCGACLVSWGAPMTDFQTPLEPRKVSHMR